jgi:hypothetical protein
MRCHHYCNTLYCPECIRRFWKWAENHTRSKGKRKGPNFYDHIHFKGASPSGTASAPHADEAGSTPAAPTGSVPKPDGLRHRAL